MISRAAVALAQVCVSSVCNVCILSVLYPSVFVRPFPPCTPGIFSVLFLLHCTCLSSAPCLSVCLSARLPVSIEGKTSWEESSSLSLSFF